MIFCGLAALATGKTYGRGCKPISRSENQKQFLMHAGANIVFGTAVIIFEVVTMSKDDDDDAEVEGRMLRG